MKIVIDTNVIISGFFFPEKPSLILKAWRNRLLEPVMSAEIFEEYREVLIRLSRKYPAVQVGPIIDLLAVEIPMVKPAKLNSVICVDPDDDKFIACAVSAKAKRRVGAGHPLTQPTALTDESMS